MNIPIFRAKKIDSDKYVEGFYKNVLYFKDKHIITSLVNISGVENNIQKTNLWDYKNYEIDPTTLAIHFPDMLDSEGNKIFASLSEDGKGGDCTFMENDYNEKFCWDRLNACVLLKSRNYECRCFRNGSRNETVFNTYKIIGIQK